MCILPAAFTNIPYMSAWEFQQTLVLETLRGANIRIPSVVNRVSLQQCTFILPAVFTYMCTYIYMIWHKLRDIEWVKHPHPLGGEPRYSSVGHICTSYQRQAPGGWDLARGR